MTVAMVDLRQAIAETRPAWTANLTAMHERGQYILGPQGEAFEREFAAHLGARAAVGVGTGTAAIELCLRAAGITSREQEVLVPALTSPFTAQAVIAAGATPRFVDVDAETLLIDAYRLDVHAGPRTAALIAVHLYGQASDLSRLSAFAESRGLTLVQDACQAHGATHAGQPFTAFSPYVAYSFYPTKNLGALGDGGAVVTDDLGVEARLRLLRDGGRLPSEQVSRTAALNSRLDEMQACYLRAFLPRLREWNAHRAHVSAIYDAALRGCPEIRPVRRSACSAHHLYVVRAERRDELRSHLLQAGVQTGVHYPQPLHLQPAFAGYGHGPGSLPHAEQACREIVSLPLGPHVSQDAAEHVAASVRAFYGGARHGG